MGTVLFSSILLLFLTIPFQAFPFDKDDYKRPVDPDSVEIVRDMWGVAHVFGKTDNDAAYGLAWSHAEDDFESIQKMYMMASGVYGLHKGKDGAKFDYVLKLLKIPQLVDEHYDEVVSDSFKTYLQAYTQGINDYARTHPEEVAVKRMYPIGPKDALKGYLLSFVLLQKVNTFLEKIMEGSIDDDTEMFNIGSNAFALNPSITEDSSTYITINAHQTLEGQVAFHEIHMVSEEGMNFLGGTFPGAVSGLHGSNPNLAWAHTSNSPNEVDVYELTMHPEKENYYKFDGEWLKLEKRKVKLSVKILGFLPFPVKREAYWSKYGATVKTDSGVYSIRFAGNMKEALKAPEQWYKMTKAKNFSDFHSALEMQGIPTKNIIYADRQDNIYFLSNALIPKRKPGFNWQGVVRGDTSATLWHDFYDIDQLPQVKNPSCGYILNVNHTPFNCTCEEENPRMQDFDKEMAFMTRDNNRSIRFKQLLEKYGPRISYKEMKKIKFDTKFPENTTFMDMIYEVQSLDTSKYPEIAPILKEFRKWNLKMTPENRQAAIFMMTAQFIFDKHDLRTLGFRKDLNFKKSTYRNALAHTQDHLRKHFGRLDVRYGQVLRLKRGDKEYPMGGFPDVMRSMMGQKQEDGTFKAWIGEDYMQLLRFTDDTVKTETVDAYGVSNDPESQHYTDQMPLFINKNFKDMTHNPDEVYRKAEEIYHPGEEH